MGARPPVGQPLPDLRTGDSAGGGQLAHLGGVGVGVVLVVAVPVLQHLYGRATQQPPGAAGHGRVVDDLDWSSSSGGYHGGGGGRRGDGHVGGGTRGGRAARAGAGVGVVQTRRTRRRRHGRHARRGGHSHSRGGVRGVDASANGRGAHPGGGGDTGVTGKAVAGLTQQHQALGVVVVVHGGVVQGRGGVSRAGRTGAGEQGARSQRLQALHLPQVTGGE